MKVGDTVVRVMPGFKYIGERLWRYTGHITKIDDDVITAEFLIDGWTTMQFDRKTLVNLNGKDYGWLEEVEGGNIQVHGQE